jgi:hypothetical protein
MTPDPQFTNATKALASGVAGLLAFAAYAFGLSPEFASQYFIDAVTGVICSAGSVYYTWKHRGEQPPA